MEKLILTNYQAPGDVVMLTAAVRDLHRCHPGQYLTDVQTSCPELWEQNPHLTPLRQDDPGVRMIGCGYPLIHESHHRPIHFLEGFIEDLNRQLGSSIRLTKFQGDIHLSTHEKSAPSPLSRRLGMSVPYWIVVAGGKYDFTIKWWHFRRWQAVVDQFQGRLLFVQVGETDHFHPPLSGVLDLRGQTTLRELVQLVYHADGVICPVTLLMHLAAAVEAPPGHPPNRPCVVVAGGRESPHWEGYPTHQFLHTVGTLPCCAQGGCWRSRVIPLGDGDEKDEPPHLCVDVRKGLPACMDLITAADVGRAIHRHLDGGMARSLNPSERRDLQPFLRVRWLEEIDRRMQVGKSVKQSNRRHAHEPSQ
jgi:ADP-heptose:LPS heptosyltransferase